MYSLWIKCIDDYHWGSNTHFFKGKNVYLKEEGLQQLYTFSDIQLVYLSVLRFLD